MGKRLPLTQEERARIFSSDVIHYKDYAKLRQISDTRASTEINDIKRYFGDEARATRAGCIDVRDYMAYFGYTWEDIYRTDTRRRRSVMEYTGGEGR